jgi:hypothetical protein
MSTAFVLSMVIFALFLGAILTAANNEDQTHGL